MNINTLYVGSHQLLKFLFVVLVNSFVQFKIVIIDSSLFVGHATMATSYVLLTQTDINPGVTLRFDTLSGELTVSSVPKEGDDPTLYIEMNFPLGFPKPVDISDSIQYEMKQALQLPSSTTFLDIQFCSRTKKLLVVVDSVDVIHQIVPLIPKLESIVFPVPVKGLICTTQYTGDDYQQYDIVSRYFAPWNGIPEDPVTGNGHL